IAPFSSQLLCFFFTDTAPSEIYTLSLHDALPISRRAGLEREDRLPPRDTRGDAPELLRIAEGLEVQQHEVGLVVLLPPFEQVVRSEEHTSELQSRSDLVCRLLLEKKKSKSLSMYK